MKRAILIGSSEYDYLQNLNCVLNDVNSIQEVLENAGYLVFKIINGDYDEIKRFIYRSKKAISETTVDLFEENSIFIYVSGHGTVYNGNDCFLPSDFDGDYNKVINVLDILKELDFINYGWKKWTKLLFVDMCRTGNTKEQLHGTLNEFENCFIGFSSLRDTVSYTQGTEMSKFTKELVSNMRVPGLTIQEIFQSTKYALGRFYDEEGQLPICYDSLINDIYLLKEDQFDVKTPEDYYEKGKKYIQYSYRKNSVTRQRLQDIGIRLIRTAADMGIDEAKIDMGYFCTNNTYMKQYGIQLRDYELACEYYNAVSEKNKAKALNEMAHNVYLNKFQNKLYNPEYAEKLFIESFEKYRYYESAMSLGYFYHERENYKKAFYYFDICAKNNMEDAMYRIGEYYEHGMLDISNSKKAILYYEKAYNLWKVNKRDLEFNNAVCLYKLAKSYNNDRNDEAKVILKYLEKADVLNDVRKEYRKRVLYRLKKRTVGKNKKQ